jgi:glyoxylase-like metal-dependent hydrolase (beta-lactamase superfamily II)
MMDLDPRPIAGSVSVHNFQPEHEKSSRWSFMKVLREHSDLKEYYPDVNPFVECYKVRPNTYALFSPSIMPGCGDVWSYLVIGPERALLIDTAFGLGNIRKLAEHLAPDREILCFNTHRHVDHIGGNFCFDAVYINEYDAELLKRQMAPGYMAGFLLDEQGKPKSSDFDPKNLVPFRPYEVKGVPSGFIFDLGVMDTGEPYRVEVNLISGHTAGESGIYDRVTGCFFMGDATSALLDEGESHPELCTIRSLHDCIVKIIEAHGDKISGVFPGHGTFDLHPVTLSYLAETAQSILDHPDWHDREIDWFGRKLFTRNIYQFGSDLKYTMDTVG